MSSVQEKLYNYEQTPPPGVWDKINAALDESHLSDEFPTKLYNAEVIPPANAWDKITAALEPVQVPVVPMHRKTFSFFRYAAAAVLVGLVAFGVIKWTSGNNTKSENGITVVDTAKQKRLIDPPVEENRNRAHISDPVQTTEASNSVVKTSSAKKARNNNYTISEDINTTEPIYAYEHTPNLADRYIMLMTPDGGIIRMSKKWGNLVCCVSGQDQDENCKDQLKKWQEKIACSPVTTSAGNFMDILSLVSALNDSEL